MQLQPDYTTGTSHKIVIRAKQDYIPINILIKEFQACDLKQLLEANEDNEFDFDIAAEFEDDFLLVYFGDDWEVTLRPTNNGAILYRLLGVLQTSPEFNVEDNLKHPVFAKLGLVGKVWACLAGLGVLLIVLIDEAPGDPNITGWQLALFAVLLSLFGTGLHAAIGQAGASVGTKFPKPMSLNFYIGEFAVWILIFRVAFS